MPLKEEGIVGRLQLGADGAGDEQEEREDREQVFWVFHGGDGMRVFPLGISIQPIFTVVVEVIQRRMERELQNGGEGTEGSQPWESCILPLTQTPARLT